MLQVAYVFVIQAPFLNWYLVVHINLSSCGYVLVVQSSSCSTLQTCPSWAQVSSEPSPVSIISASYCTFESGNRISYESLHRPAWRRSSLHEKEKNPSKILQLEHDSHKLSLKFDYFFAQPFYILSIFGAYSNSFVCTVAKWVKVVQKSENWHYKTKVLPD